MFSWFIFLSATAALDRGMHFSVNLVGQFLPNLGSRILKTAVLLVVLAVLCVFVSRGWVMTIRNWRQLSSAMQIPLSFANAAIPISAMLMILITLRDLFAPTRPTDAVS